LRDPTLYRKFLSLFVPGPPPLLYSNLSAGVHLLGFLCFVDFSVLIPSYFRDACRLILSRGSTSQLHLVLLVKIISALMAGPLPFVLFVMSSSRCKFCPCYAPFRVPPSFHDSRFFPPPYEIFRGSFQDYLTGDFCSDFPWNFPSSPAERYFFSLFLSLRDLRKISRYSLGFLQQSNLCCLLLVVLTGDFSSPFPLTFPAMFVLRFQGTGNEDLARPEVSPSPRAFGLRLER